MSVDVIAIKDLRVPTHVGWTDEERARSQVVSIDLELHADLSKASLSDDLADTVDYDALVREVDDLVRSSKAKLLEKLGEDIAASISRYRVVDRVTVVIRKVELELSDVELGEVAVRIERAFT